VINSVLPLLALPLVAAILTAGLRRSATLSALIAAGLPLAGALWALTNDLSTPLTLLGRELVLTTGDRFAVAYLFVCAAATFMGIWRTSPNWSYYPVTLLSLTAVVMAIGARPVEFAVIGGRPFDPFHYSVIFLTVACMLAIFPLQGGQPGVANGTVRFMALMIIACPAFLTAAWMMDQFTQSPDVLREGVAQTAGVLILFGLAVWLGVVPFHAWLPGIASEAPPLSSAFVLGIINVAAWFLMLDMFHEIKMLHDNPALLAVLRTGGIITTLVGGGLALAQRDFGRLMGYAVLSDIGVTLVALGTGTAAGLSAALVVVFMRTFGLGLMSMGLATARGRLPDDNFESLTGLAWRLPWAAVVLIIGGFSLAGLPPFAGFTGRWAALQQVAYTDLPTSLALLISTIGVAAGTLRGLQYVLQRPEKAVAAPDQVSPLTIGLLVGALTLTLLFGLFPDLIALAIRQMVAAYTG
jgi:formate hydrogenlyase subunit 3/multisubunit Na+/H+ antiporter MnhD subunit